nr:uncharacterized protein LOC129282757 [Lytechinus pictus]
MGRYSCRVATTNDVPTVYDLLNEYVVEQGLEEEFTNSKQAFSDHHERELFTAIITEVTDEAENKTEIIGCAFISFPYNYIVGTCGFIHCCYVKPSHRDRGLQQMLLKMLKKVAAEKGTHFMMGSVCGKDHIFDSALEAEGLIDMATLPSGASDLWFMANPSTTPEFSSDDYVVREGSFKDLDDVYDLCNELMKFEKIEEHRPANFTKEVFSHDGGLDDPPYGAIVVEHRRRVDDEENEVRPDIVGCILYTKMYHTLRGDTYWLQGLYISPQHTGKGLGKPLVRASLEVIIYPLLSLFLLHAE